MEKSTSNGIKHPRRVIGYRGSRRRLAYNVGRMTYDEVAGFLGDLAADLSRQAKDDLELRKRKKLAGRLKATAKYLSLAQTEAQAAWQICEPFMKRP